MTEFVQLHLLTSYPPANLNRDDLGRPKTAVVGGTTRLRVSSQSLKRAWRQSNVFKEALGEHRGWRTRELALHWVKKPLLGAEVDEKLAHEVATKVAGVFGKLDADAKEPLIRQLAHVSPEERRGIETLVETVARERRLPTEEELTLLRKDHKAVDVALFGRMLAADPAFNMEAAAQVAHAITVHPVTVEDDYFTAVDDLNERQEDVGAGHVGETLFGAGVFYLYACIDRDALVANLQGDSPLANRALAALTEAACTIAPSGKQNSFASRAYASFVLVEKGDRQPRSLAVSFLRPVRGEDYLVEAVAALDRQVEAFDRAYGPLARERYRLDVADGAGSLAELVSFVSTNGSGA